MLAAREADGTMIADSTVVLGLVIPSSDPLFLAILALHIVAGLICVVTGAVAMASTKGHRRHTHFGITYVRANLRAGLIRLALPSRCS